MSAEPLYEAELYWSESANNVTVKGGFDNWTDALPMEKTSAGWVAKVSIPYASRVEFKFIVDGEWKVNHHFPTTFDKRGNLNNYIVAPQPPPQPSPAPVAEPEVVPEPVAESEPVPEEVLEATPAPAPAPQVVIEEAKPVETAPPAEPEPVTPINAPGSVEPAVTPMVVPPSAISPLEGLSDVDPSVSRQIIEAVLEAEKDGGKEVEIAGENAETLVVKVDKPVEEPKEVVETVVVAESAPIGAPAVPAIVEAEKDLATPKGEPKALSEAAPVVDTSAPAADIELNSPVAKPSTPPPTTVPAPSTPAPVDTKSTPKAEDPQSPPSAWSTGSTTTTPSKPERPGTLSGSIKKSSSRGSRIFSFPGRRSSQDATADSTPSTPGSVRNKESPETARKKKNSFMAKVHDIFHPHHKQQASP